LSKINALRSAASSARSDATANEGHVNYDVSDVSVKAIGSHTTEVAAPQMGIAHTMMQKIGVDFFVGARGGASTIHTPPMHA
jgi:hypothetical protein